MRHSIPRNSCLFWDHLLILSQFRNSFAEACAKAFARVTTLHYCNKTESAVSVTLMCSMSCGGGGRVVQWCSVNVQFRGVLLIWIIVGQGATALAVGAVGVIWTFFSLSIISHLFLPLSGRRPDID